MGEYVYVPSICTIRSFVGYFFFGQCCYIYVRVNYFSKWDEDDVGNKHSIKKIEMRTYIIS